VHRDWTPNAIVSSVAFMPLFPATRGRAIVSGHFDGALRFWWKSPDSSIYRREATLKPQDAAYTLIAHEGLGEHEKSGVEWSSRFR